LGITGELFVANREATGKRPERRWPGASGGRRTPQRPERRAHAIVALDRAICQAFAALNAEPSRFSWPDPSLCLADRPDKRERRNAKRAAGRSLRRVHSPSQDGRPRRRPHSPSPDGRPRRRPHSPSPDGRPRRRPMDCGSRVRARQEPDIVRRRQDGGSGHRIALSSPGAVHARYGRSPPGAS